MSCQEKSSKSPLLKNVESKKDAAESLEEEIAEESGGRE